MISKNKIKYIQSLHRKKTRDEEALFIVEGDKSVMEALVSGFHIRTLCATIDFIITQRRKITSGIEVIEVDELEMKKISTLQSPQRALCIIEMPRQEQLETLPKDLSLALDGIQDPGNLGTIIRSADWFGVKNIYCSLDTADCYNPKVIQATMGAIFRVNIHYVNLTDLLQQALKENICSYGTFLEGDCLYDTPVSAQALLVMGNEGNGIREETEKYIGKRINIPAYASSGSESLNVSTATSICLAEFRRVHRK